jgi:hypothetical protein
MTIIRKLIRVASHDSFRRRKNLGAKLRNASILDNTRITRDLDFKS